MGSEAVAIELGSVDVIDAEFDCAADYADGAVTVVFEPIELHRAEADSRHGASCEGRRSPGMGLRLDRAGLGHQCSSRSGCCNINSMRQL